MGTKSNRSSGTQHNPRGVTQGNTLVDPNTGLPIGVITDGSGVRRLAVDANLSAQDIQVQVELDYQEDSVHIGDPNTDTIMKVNPDGSIDSNVEVDALDGDNIAITAHPTVQQIFAENPDTITTSGFEEIFSYTSSDDDTRISLVECNVSTPSEVRLLVDGNIKRVLWTSPEQRNAVFNFIEHYSLLSGQELTIEAKVDRFIHSTYETFVSLQGYRA